MILLPCPFCGDVPELPDGRGTQYEIYCDCGMSMSAVQIVDLMTIDERVTGWIGDKSSYKDIYVNRAKDYVIKQWNTRKS